MISPSLLKLAKRWLVLLALVASLALAMTSMANAYDNSKFCDKDAIVAIIFVDVTTKFDERSKALFQDGITKILERLTGGQKVIIQTIEDSFSASQRLYEGCVPFCPSEGMWDWLLSDCTAGLIKLRERDQRSAISSALKARLSHASDLNNSEIVRTLAFTLGPFASKSDQTEIYIFSDMIENSEYMPGKLFWSQPVEKSLLDIQQNRLLPSLQGMEVKVFGVGRGGDAGRKPLSQPLLNRIKDFWEEYFKKAGAKDILIAETIVVD